MTHTFDTAIAKKHGLNAAAVYDCLRYWISINKAKRLNLRDGRIWTFNSVQSWANLMGYLTAKQIRRALDDLREAGLILTGNYNKNPYDQTLWYTLNSDDSLCPNGQIEIAPEGNSTPAPQGDSPSNRIPSENTPLLLADAASDFGKEREAEQAKAVYALYPRKVGKVGAMKAIAKALKRKPYKDLMDATAAYASAVARWPGDAQNFVPHPATWFNRGSYDDDPKTWIRNDNTDQNRTSGFTPSRPAPDKYAAFG